MKNKNLLLLLLFLLSVQLNVMSQTSGVSYSNGGNFANPNECLTEQARNEIQSLISQNIKSLQLDEQKAAESAEVSDLIFPLRMVGDLDFFHFHGVSNYVDHDASNGISDYKCLSNTYNGHKGTDFFTFPFPWYLYENNLVEVIAAVPGTIVLKQDGRPDTNCSPSGEWNAIYILHNDGSVLWYGHLKSGSLTAKNIGETVAQGEYLGVVASSGYSTGPHLHLECYDGSNQLLDPYDGTCNSLNPNSLWLDQPEHKNPRINAILTHDTRPNIECGPANEVVSFQSSFLPNEEIYVGIYITDYVPGETCVTKIIRPDSSLYTEFNTSSSQSYQWFYNYKRYVLSDAELEGVWTIQCDYRGETFTRNFEFINGTTSTTAISESTITVYPNPATNKIFIDGTALTNKTYQLINTAGQVISEGPINQHEIELGDLTNGLYYLNVSADDKSFIKKIIISQH